MTTELTTLKTFYEASNASNFTEPLALYNAYKAAPKEHEANLKAKGLWYSLSATQGNITEAGVEALKAAGLV